MLEGPNESGSRDRASYLSYLLRIWSKSGEGAAEKWLASVESPLTGEQHHFADLESLFAFLRAMTGQTALGEGESKNRFSNFSNGIEGPMME